MLALRTKISRWFKGSSSGPVRIELPLESNANGNGNGHGDNTLPVVRSSFLRPWAKRDAAIANLQRGFDTMTDLMLALRESLDTQNKRQEELLTFLDRLPEALHGIPETNRAHAETLRALHQQIAYQSQQHNRVGNILDKIGEAAGQQQKALHNIHERLEMMEHHNQMSGENLQSMGLAMQGVNRNTDKSARELIELRNTIYERNATIEEAFKKQSTRMTTMLATTIVISVLSLGAVIAMGYLLVSGSGGNKPAPAVAPTSQPVSETAPVVAPEKPATSQPS